MSDNIRVIAPDGQTLKSFLTCKHLNIDEIIDLFKYYFLNDINNFGGEIKLQINRTLVELTHLKKELELEVIIQKTQIPPENILTIKEAIDFIKDVKKRIINK